jgi:NAD dependent epimerase/dehydratase family enzyme
MGQELLLEGQRVLPARLLAAGFAFGAPTIDVALEGALAA